MIRLIKLAIMAAVLIAIMLFSLKPLRGEVAPEEIRSAMVSFCVCQNENGRTKSRCISDYRESGFFVSPRLILTTYRVIEANPKGIYFYRGDRRYSAYPVAFDQSLDIALLESCDLESTFSLKMGFSVSVETPVLAYDNAIGSQFCQDETEKAEGVIEYSIEKNKYIFVSNGPFAISFSGGPILDKKTNEVIGMNARPTESDCNGTLIPAEKIEEFLSRLEPCKQIY